MNENAVDTDDVKQSMDDFWEELDRKNIKLWLEGDSLRYKAPKGEMTPTLLEIIKTRKPEIILCLTSAPEQARKSESAIFYDPIPSAPPAEDYPLSSAQQRMFLLQQLDPESTAYNLTQALKLVGPVNREQIEAIIHQIINRHEVLRTSFEFVAGNIRQRIYPAIDFKLEYEEVYPAEIDIEQLIQRFMRPYVLSRPPLFRFKLLKLIQPQSAAPETHLLLYDTHHIISDGVSLGILVGEINHLYAGQPLPDLKTQYRDYTLWHQNLLTGNLIKTQKEYWLKKFQGEIPVLNLLPDYPRPKVYRFEGSSIKERIDQDALAQIYQLARGNHATVYQVLLSAYYILLARYTGLSDIIIGTPTAGRRHADLNGQIGVFLNMLALRNYPEMGKTFREFLAEVAADVLAAFDNQEYPFEELVETLNIGRNLSRNPLFDTMFILQNMQIEPLIAAGLAITPYEFQRHISQFDLVLVATETEGAMEFELTYCTHLYAKVTAARLLRSYLKLIAEIIKNLDIQLGRLDLLPESEKNQLIHVFNDTCRPYPREKTISELFEEQVERTPDQIALISKDTQLTYRELNSQANRLARFLRAQGVKAGNLIGILCERSAHLIVGIMAVLKAGGAYLPVDPEYPPERIAYMLNDSQPLLVLTQGKQALPLEYPCNGAQLVLDELTRARDFTQAEASNLTRSNTAKDLAYVIYTSGSTGKPKGVMIEHGSVHNFIRGIMEKVDFAPGKVILGITTVSFDIFGTETFPALKNGLTIVLADENEQRDPQLLKELLKKQRIQLFQSTPSRLQLLFNDTPSGVSDLSWLEQIDTFMIGGEPFPEPLFHQLRSVTDAKVYNMYGPTETTIWSAVKDLTSGAGISIGRPIANTQIYIVDPQNQPQPMGVAGELWIAGDGLARGYLNQPELTAEKFIPNPLVIGERAPQGTPLQSPPGKHPDSEVLIHTSNFKLQTLARFYKTGDLARWLPDGDLEFLGRIDHQVKLRGFRIELGEIESRLQSHEQIKEAVVMAGEEPTGNKYLCAYLVIDSQVGEGELSVQDLRAYLAVTLPDYMIPSYFIQLAQLPLTPNGKVDRKSLVDRRALVDRKAIIGNLTGFGQLADAGKAPLPEGGMKTGAEYLAPGTELEHIISNAWKEILACEQMGVNDNFFHAGGNSLSIIKLNVLLNQKLNRQIPTVILFQYPTIRSFTQYLLEKEGVEEHDTETIMKRDDSIASRKTAEPTGVEIAVIGMAGRFPGAKNIREFWKNLKNGVESIHFFTETELEEAGIERDLLQDPKYVKAKGVLDQIEYFDAAFFGYNPKDAQMLDPQIRIFQECVWEALEDAGYDPARTQQTIGLFAGANANYFWEVLGLVSSPENTAEQFTRTQMFDRFLSTRISFNLNLTGPSIFVTTACSTSLVAVHLACRSLLMGECDIALAGGVALALPSKSGYLYQEGMIMSPDGHCRAFDAKAAGTVWGEGAGAVVLKPLAKAITDGDHIEAIIKGTAINNDGLRKVGYTAPSIDGQADVIRSAQSIAQVEPESISYVETHGTGTILGDPIEIEALKTAFHTDKKQFCRIGSVKTNIGHLDSAAGIAGFIKTVLALKHRQIPPSLHFRTPNPKIDFKNSPFMVNTQLVDWQNDLYPLRAGISSFGIGGTNAHVVLQEPPPVPVGPIHESPLQERPGQLIMVSAKTETALSQICANLAGYLQEHPDTDLADFAYTLGQGRAHFPYRRSMVVNDIRETITQLTQPAPPHLAASPPHAPAEAATAPEVTFMFPGQGSQYPNLGRELYETEAVFRETMNYCNRFLKTLLKRDLITLLYPAQESGLPEGDLYETALTQPVIFSVEYSLARLLMSWGLKPQRMIGHSIGEYVAACLAGVFSLEDALTLVTCRGRLMQEMARGAMLSVPLSEAELKPFMDGHLSLAAVNSPALCVVAGPEPAIRALEDQLRRQTVDSVRLPVSHAFHSAMMEPAAAAYIEEVKQIKLSIPKIPFLSNVTGNWIRPEEATSPEYWGWHLRNTVRFAAGVNQLLEMNRALFFEVGGGRTLTGLIREFPAFNSKNHLVFNSLPHPRETISDRFYLLTMIGNLWRQGIALNWEAFLGTKGRRRLSLPTYPFERQRFWNDRNINDIREAIISKQTSSGKKQNLEDWFYTPSWKRVDFIPEERNRDGNIPILVFANELPFSIQLIRRLRQENRKLVLVKLGDWFQREGEGCFTLNPRRQEDYQNLFHSLEGTGTLPQKIIHLWTLTRAEAPAPKLAWDPAQIENMTDWGFYSLLYLAQALNETKRSSDFDISIKVITNQLQSVTGTEKILPEKALVLGPVKIIPREFSKVQCECIDIEIPNSGGTGVEELVSYLLTELDARSNDLMVAFRGKSRWIPIFEPVKLKRRRPPEEVPICLREKGVYLITGGLGSIGLVMAEMMAKRVRAKLILVGRSGLPAKHDWGTWLQAHEETDQRAQKIRKIQEIESYGGEVMALKADITDAEQMKQAVAVAEAQFGKINGIFHCAGLADGALIELRNRETTDPILGPKVKGTLVLDQLFYDKDLDFLILYSSINSMIPFLGQSGYCAANCFLDAYAHSKNITSRAYTLSINWDTWREVGMAVAHSATWANANALATAAHSADEAKALAGLNSSPGDDGYAAMLANGILSAEGMEVMARILDQNLSRFPVLNQVIVSTVPLEERYREAVTFNINSLQTNLQKTPQTQLRYPRPDLPNPYLAPRNATEIKLAEAWQEVLGFEKIGIEDDFFALGGDSLKAIRILAVSKKYGLTFEMKSLLNYPVIGDLAQSVQELHAGPNPRMIQGPAGLLQTQRRFFDRNYEEMNFWNGGFILYRQAGFQEGIVKKVFERMVEHHEALRVVFQREAGQIIQSIRGYEAGLFGFHVVDFRDEARPGARTDYETKIKSETRKTQATLDLYKGPLLRVVLYKTCAGDHLSIIIHHLIFDGVTMQIITDDFRIGYEQAIHGQAIAIPPKTASLTEWSRKLSEYAVSQELKTEIEYWKMLESTEAPPLPRDFVAPSNKYSLNRPFTQNLLSEPDTARLLRGVREFKGLEFKAVLLTALGLALKAWTGQPKHKLYLISHGRDPVFEGLDISRTVGWFSHQYPILLELSTEEKVAAQLQQVQVMLNNIPKYGFGYEILRYFRDPGDDPPFDFKPWPEISFNYLGEFEPEGTEETAIFTSSPIGPGLQISPNSERDFTLVLELGISQGVLYLRIQFNRLEYKADTIIHLVGLYRENLLKIM